MWGEILQSLKFGYSGYRSIRCQVDTGANTLFCVCLDFANRKVQDTVLCQLKRTGELEGTQLAHQNLRGYYCIKKNLPQALNVISLS